jgi:hypothetical protein
MTSFEVMTRRLQAHQPPSLVAIMEKFDSSESLAMFVDLIREFLPEHKETIMEPINAEKRIEKFIHFFGRRYFELAEYDFSDGYETFVREVPIGLQGISYENYEGFAEYFSPEWFCMASLVSYPFYLEEGKTGAEDRVPFLDATLNLTSQETIRRIPAVGFTPPELHEKLDHTQYAALALFADWLHSDTGLWQLDANYEDNSEGPSWTKEDVEELTRQAPLLQEFQRKVLEFEQWLHEDLRSHFAELVNALVSPVPKEQMRLLKEGNEQDED